MRRLQELGIRPSERLGQHFLVDPRGLQLFLSRMEGGDAVEIGPGLGALTYYASAKLSRIVAVELDGRLARQLAANAPPNVAVAHAEGLSFLSSMRVGFLYSNTPFNISSAVVAVAARNNYVRRLLLGVQKELALRMIAKEGEESYGRLTLLVKRYFSTRLVGVMGREQFYPVPKVSGAVVELERVREWREGDELFEEVTRCLFSGRNKRAEKMARICTGKEVKLGEKRVEELSLEEVEAVVQARLDAARRDNA
ncbi:MAG: hypothetical protein N3F67_05255 [Acidilobaceae archaeon]|nr:hypothetical protein [Acidilobaceae archaeon]